MFVVACKKCFKTFDLGDEPECAEFVRLADGCAKTLAGLLKVDFLCNEARTAKQLKAALPAHAENIIVISCGLGVQTVAGMAGLPVFGACDSIGSGMNGMALTKLLCEACSQCCLDLTGGVCPIVDCPKGLINGQCGGSKNRMCEVDKNKDCAWDKIFERLSAQGRTGILSVQPVQIRDYSRISFRLISDYVKSIREKRFEGYYGGFYPHDDKEFSRHLPLKAFPAPQTVVIPLSQHAGAPAQPLVKAGDAVRLGQKIGEATGPVSSTVHASVSGTVVAVEPRRSPAQGQDALSVVIKSDGKDELHESVKPPWPLCSLLPGGQSSLSSGDQSFHLHGGQSFLSPEALCALSPDDIIALIREKGIVGMGGAAFPTSVKISPPKPIDTILLNGCESEPLLTADHRVMLEYPDDVLFGLQALLRTTGAANGLIAIEDNKGDAIELLKSKSAGIADVGIVTVKTKYPQGAERMLIRRALGRHVPSGALPADVGVIVFNVSTAKAVSDAIRKGLPLIERVVTVSGEKIRNPGNFIVRIGTSVREIVDYCGGVTDSDAVVKLGGPMMGVELPGLDVPVTKGTGGIIAVGRDISEPSPCIRCGRCVDVCPMELLPLYYPQYAGRADWEGMSEKSVMDCIECGCCDDICSSRIPIREAIRLGTKELCTRA